MNTKLKVLDSGAGFAGQGHTDAFRGAGCGIVGRAQSVVSEVADQLAIPYSGTNWQDALNTCRPDIVFIARPEGSHYEPIVQAIEFGCHVFATNR